MKMSNLFKTFSTVIIFILMSSCSFDKISGFWSGSEDEKRRLEKIENLLSNDNIYKIFSSKIIFADEIQSPYPIKLTTPVINDSWTMPNLNYQNFTGNLDLSGFQSNFLKKKIGKNKFDISKNSSAPLIKNNSIFLSDDVGTVFNISFNGKINWKKNIYKKIYKKIYKNLTFTVYKDNIYVADNIGFLYSIDLNTGELNWVKNLLVPINSHLKIYEDKIFLINQENRVLALNIEDGNKIWDLRTVTSFIKLQHYLGMAITKEGDLIALTSTGDLYKIKTKNGSVYWTLNATGSLFKHDTDFFKASELTINENNLFFSASASTFSYNIKTGYLNWKQDVASVGTPIVVGDNIFIFTNNGYFVNLEKNTGKIVWSTNAFKNLSKKKKETFITGFIMGSGKVYAVTLNGFLIVCSATTGELEEYVKIGDSITSSPIISEKSLFILTENSKIYGFN